MRETYLPLDHGLSARGQAVELLADRQSVGCGPATQMTVEPDPLDGRYRSPLLELIGGGESCRILGELQLQEVDRMARVDEPRRTLRPRRWRRAIAKCHHRIQQTINFGSSRCLELDHAPRLRTRVRQFNAVNKPSFLLGFFLLGIFRLTSSASARSGLRRGNRRP